MKITEELGYNKPLNNLKENKFDKNKSDSTNYKITPVTCKVKKLRTDK